MCLFCFVYFAFRPLQLSLITFMHCLRRPYEDRQNGRKLLELHMSQKVVLLSRPLSFLAITFWTFSFPFRTAAAPQLASQHVSLRPEAAEIRLRRRRRHWRKWRPRESPAMFGGGRKSFWRCARVTWRVKRVCRGLREWAKSSRGPSCMCAN